MVKVGGSAEMEEGKRRINVRVEGKKKLKNEEREQIFKLFKFRRKMAVTSDSSTSNHSNSNIVVLIT